MFCLSQLDTMLDPASYKDGFPNPDHVWTSFEVLVFLTAQGDSSHICLSISLNCLFIYSSVEHYTVLYLII